MGAGNRQNKSYAIDRYPELKDQKLQDQQELNEMLGVDISTISTADLVHELCSREGVMRIDLPNDEWVFQGVLAHPVEESSAKINEIGPAQIIVVQGVE